MDSKYKTHKEHAFDSFCKKVVKNEARDIYKKTKNQRKNEISLEDLTESDLEQLAVFPRYSTDNYSFEILDLTVETDNDFVGSALNSLEEDKRNIILLSYFLNMNDDEIAKALNLVRRTVHYKRVTTLQKLKEIMEEVDTDDEPK